ncbi:MAG: hypothetical protein RL215_391 [Planctomycetota bacterium]
MGEWSEVIGMIEVLPAQLLKRLKGDPFEHWVFGVESGANECFVGVEEPGLRSIQCMCKPPEKLCVGDSFTSRRDCRKV